MTWIVVGVVVYFAVLGTLLAGMSLNKRIEASELRGFGETER